MVKPVALKALRFGMAVGSLLMPRMTARFAFNLFCKPPRSKKLSEKEAAMKARAEKRMARATQLDMPYRDGPYSDAAANQTQGPEETLRAYVFDPDAAKGNGKTVILIHGWTGQAAFMLSFVEPLLAKGFRVVAVDLPAHGASSGRQLHLPKSVKAISELHGQTGPWHGIIAHSFGGAIAAVLASGTMPSFPKIALEKLVLIATPFSMAWIFHGFGSVIGLTAKTQALLDAMVEPLSGRSLESFEGVDMLRAAGVPTLLLHAPDDKEVPFSGAETMATAGNFVTLLPLPKLGHRRILYAPDTIRAAIGHINGTVTSGASVAAE